MPLGLMNPAEGRRTHDIGMKLLESGRPEEAIPFFERALAYSAIIAQPHNNLALSHFQAGNVEKAIEIAENLDRKIDSSNTFGLGNLVQFYQFCGRDEDARRALARLKTSTPPDPFACLKKCEALSRFKLHAEVLAAAVSFATGSGPGAEVSYFAGTALANLSRFDEAMGLLNRARNCPVHSARVERYIKCLERKAVPQTLEGGWPYLEADEWMPPGLLRWDLGNAAVLKKYPGVVEALVAILDDSTPLRDPAIELLGMFNSDRARSVLQKLASGALGSYALSQSKALERDAPIEICFSACSKDLLLGIARRLHVAPDESVEQKTALALVALCLRDAGRIWRAAQELPETAKEAIKALLSASGVMDLVEFTKRFGSHAGDSADPSLRHPTSTLSWLRAFGLAIVASVDGKQSVLVPVEVLRALKHELAAP